MINVPTGTSHVVQMTVLCVLLFLTLASNTMAASEEGQRNVNDLMDLSIEQLGALKVGVVSGASRYEQKVTEAPSSISIISADDIKKYGHRTLADILRSVRSFFVTYDRNYSYSGVRGFGRPGDYNTRILLLVDGHRINDAVYEQATVGTELPLDVDLIDRIEIIRGPGSSLYGSNAFFAVVNVITRNAGDLRGTELSGSAGSYDTYYGRASYGALLGGGSLLLSGSSYDSRGARQLYYPEFDTPATNNGVADRKDGDRFRSVFTKFSFGDFTLEGAYGYRKKDVPTASFGAVFNAPDNRTIDEHGYADLAYRHTFGPGTQTMARVYYDVYNFQEDYLLDYPPLTGNRDTAEGEWWGGEVQVVTKPFERHKITVGAEYRDNVKQDQSNFDLDPYASYFDDRRQSRLWAFYGQDEYRVMDRVLLNAGVRRDHYSTFGDTTNPRLALIYKPVDTTIFKLIYGSAFRAPNVYELYYADGVTAKANPGLEPERIKTSELVYEQYLGVHVRSTLSLFSYRIDNLITLRTDPADGLQQYTNVDRSEARGAEMEVEGSWSKGIRGQLSYSVQKAKNLNSGEILTNSPEHLAKMNLALSLIAERLFVDPEVQYTGRRKTAADRYAASYTVANLTVYGKVIKDLNASLSVYNLFDRKYGDPGAGPPQHLEDTIEQDGRNFRVKLTYRF